MGERDRGGDKQKTMLARNAKLAANSEPNNAVADVLPSSGTDEASAQ
jgi:hypothetical protein